MNTLIKLPAKAIIDIANSKKPPSLLSKRDAGIVKAVDAFMDGLQSLKSPQQYVTIAFL
jgi:hypothetical protein